MLSVQYGPGQRQATHPGSSTVAGRSELGMDSQRADDWLHSMMPADRMQGLLQSLPIQTVSDGEMAVSCD